MGEKMREGANTFLSTTSWNQVICSPYPNLRENGEHQGITGLIPRE